MINWENKVCSFSEHIPLSAFYISESHKWLLLNAVFHLNIVKGNNGEQRLILESGFTQTKI